MKIHHVRAELFYEEGWTDRHDEDNNHFSQFFKPAACALICDFSI
jgi:hypothetical protein